MSLAMPYTADTPVAASSRRLAGVEILRLVSVLAIVWFHLGTTHRDLAYAGLPAVLIISVALSVISRSTETFAAAAARRAQRLLLPFVFWSGVFGMILVRDVFHNHRPWNEVFSPWMILGGTWYHMWYLPFAFLACMLAYLLRKLWMDADPHLLCMGWAMIGTVALVICCFEKHNTLPYPFPEWIYGTPAIFYGLAIGSLRKLSTPDASRMLWRLAACITLAGFGVLLLPDRHRPPQFEPYVLALVAACMAFSWTRPIRQWMMPLTSLSLGIYVLHPLANNVLLGRVFLHRHFPTHGATNVVLAIIISAIATWLLMRTPIKRFL